MKISSQMDICKMKLTVITLSAQQMKPYDLEFSIITNTNSTMINCSVKALGNKFIGNLIIRSYILSQYTCSNVVAYIYYTCKTFFKAFFFHLRKVFTLNDSMMLLIKLEPFPKN